MSNPKLAAAVQKVAALREDAKESAANFRTKIQFAQAEVEMLAQEDLDGQKSLFPAGVTGVTFSKKDAPILKEGAEALRAAER